MALERIEVSQHERVTPALIVVGIPTVGLVHIQQLYAQMSLRHPLNARVHYYSPIGLPTAQARNEIVARALAADASHVFFVDDDTWPPPDALINLMARRRPIVAGLYYAKTTAPQPLILHGRTAGVAQSWTPGELVDCYGHGMGCTLIETRVFVDLAEQGAVEVTDAACPVCHGASCRGCLTTGKSLRWFYTTDDQLVAPNGMPLHVHQTEDVYFLERAAAAGYQPSVDTGVFCWHYDAKTDRVYPTKQYEEFARTGRVSWETDAGVVTWPGVQPA